MGNKKEKGTPQPPTMRVQLQRDDDEDDMDTRALIPVKDAEEQYVTVKQVVDALNELAKSPKIPKSEQENAKAALAEAIDWVKKRPRAGITTDGWRKSQTFQFDKDNEYDGFRFDIENKRGHNLRS